MPHYFKDEKLVGHEQLIKGWFEITRYLRSVDPYKRLTTLHPCPINDIYCARDIISDPSLIDFDMLQTGHFNIKYDIFEKTMEKLLYLIDLCKKQIDK